MSDTEPAVNEVVAEPPGKRVSWCELFFDLVFVFAVGQVTHVIVAEPNAHGILSALGLFVTLWWTWIGFVILYNRHGADTVPDRLFLLAGTIPCAVAAIELHGAVEGHPGGFALALAGARLVLAVSFEFTSGRVRNNAGRIALGYGLSTVLFGVSAVVPSPWCYIMWGVALLQEAGFLLLGQQRRGSPRGRGRDAVRGREAVRRSRTDALRDMLRAPTDPDLAVDASHLAERFGLFMIILLGEIVVSVGAAALDVPERGPSYWVGLLGGLVLTAALWWIYFDAAAPINEYVLRASGGNPTMAYGLYAGGHLGPAFSLLLIASGVNLALHDNSGRPGSWLVTVGLGLYLVGTRAVVTRDGLRFGRPLRAAITVATVGLAFLQPLVHADAVVAIVAVWAVGLGAVVSLQRPVRMSRVATDPLSLFRRGI